MKSLTYFLIFTLISCSVKNNEQIKNDLVSQSNISNSKLSRFEKKIVNDFLEVELNLEKFTYNKVAKIILIQESININQNMLAYEYTYKDYFEWKERRLYYAKINNETNFKIDDDTTFLFLDSIQISKLKEKHRDQEKFYWKKKHILNFNVDIIKQKDFNHYVDKGLLVEMPLIRVIYISKPLIVNKDKAFISFVTSSNEFNFANVYHFTVLMKKKNKKWIKDHIYEDGVFH